MGRDRLPAAPDPRLGFALAAAKLTGVASRRLGRGGGTAAPGLIADRIDPALVAKVARRLPRGVVVVAGTNGKTTTARMLADILAADGCRVAHNRSGSNLVRGVASAFAERASLGGDPRAEVGVIESDEAALPEIVRRVAPRVILLTNLFRDQLDRYGELNTIATRWRAALAALPAEAVVVANVDDPTLAAITEGIAARRVAFGLAEPDPRYQLAALPHAADAAACRRCGRDLVYAALYSAHLGDWRCPGCGAARPPLDVGGRDVRLDGVEALRVRVEWGAPDFGGRRALAPSPNPSPDSGGGELDGSGAAVSSSPRSRGAGGAVASFPPQDWGAGGALELAVGVPGLYNVYNVVAAVAAASASGVAGGTIGRALGAFQAAFGRIERVAVGGRTLILALVKNPVGFNETLRMLTATSGGLAVPTLIAINDLAADGRDVSWLWDVDFELLAEGSAPLYTTGIRGADMANRLKYAGVPADRLRPLATDLTKGLEAFIAQVPAGGIGYVLPTYTALLGLRRTLTALGAVETFWKQ